jgi:7-carboxy-7-deazaguanine synthase
MGFAAQLGVTEIYASIQGESTHAGRPCTFVRLSGCPLRCRWCDTEYSFEKGARLSIPEVVARVAALGVPLVEVTGGEPLAQPATPALLKALADAGFEVLLETSGAYPVRQLDPRVKVIADLKCPGSGEAARNLWPELAALRPCDELKVVIAHRADFDWALEQLRTTLAGFSAPVLWSAVWAELPLDQLAAWLLAERAPGRLQVQLHKVIWPGVDRGV